MAQPVRVLVLASDPITQAGLAAALGDRPEVRILTGWPAVERSVVAAAGAAGAAAVAVGVAAGGGPRVAGHGPGLPAAPGTRVGASRVLGGDQRARLAIVPGGGAAAPLGAQALPASSGLAQSGLAQSGLAQSGPTQAGLAQSGPAQGAAVRAAAPPAVDPGADVALVSAAAVDEPTLRCVREVQQAGVPVVLVVAELDAHDLTSAVDAGVVGLLRRADATPDAVLAAVRGAAAGEGYLPPDLLGPLLRQVRQVSTQVLAPRGLSFSGLTERELTVLRLVAEGCDTREISRRLCYSERTVKNVLQDITRRFGLRNRSHAVAYALRHGLL